MNKIVIEREEKGTHWRQGKFTLILDDQEVFTCHELTNDTLTKQRGDDGALPPGIYKCGLRFSPRFSPKFQKFMGRENLPSPAIVIYNDEIPYDRYILIHNGNHDRNTAGCELIGYTRDDSDLEGFIGQSQKATTDFYKLIYDKFGTDENKELDLTLEVIDNLGE